MNIKEILSELGYNLTDEKDGFRTTANFRGGNNKTALKIFSNGSYCDFVTNSYGTFEELISLTLGLKDINSAKKWLENKNYTISEIKQEKPTLKMIKIYPPEILQELLPNHDYWLNRGISLEILKLFKGGLGLKGQQKGRFVFPVFNGKNQIIGFNGRDITNESHIKWKITGQKSNFIYPLFLNYNIIKEKKTVILVESIGDTLSCFECGICNVMCLFGTEISIPQLNFLLKIDPNKICIALNNDSANNNAGNDAAIKLEKKLLKYFDSGQIFRSTLVMKDLNEMLLKDKSLIMEWYKNVC